MAEPSGLGMSLDDLIKSDREKKKTGPERRRGSAGRRSSVGYGQRSTQPMKRQGFDRQQRSFGPPGGGGSTGGRPNSSVTRAQSCYVDEATGDVVFKYKATTLIRINAAGDITLDSGGFMDKYTFMSLNDALNLIGVRVTATGDIKSGDWSISDGKSLIRFHDGVVVPGKGPQNASRGHALLIALNDPGSVMTNNNLPMRGGRGGGRRGGRGRGSVFNRLGGGGGASEAMEMDDARRFKPY